MVNGVMGNQDFPIDEVNFGWSRIDHEASSA